MVSLALSPPVPTRFIVRNRGRLEQGCRAAENNALGNKLHLVLLSPVSTIYYFDENYFQAFVSIDSMYYSNVVVQNTYSKVRRILLYIELARLIETHLHTV